jgi:tetratricopeptide (TPR) repeat protein
MRKQLSRTPINSQLPLVLILITVLSVTLWAAACGNGESSPDTTDQSVTTTEAGSPAPSATATSTSTDPGNEAKATTATPGQRVVLDGRPAEEYEASIPSLEKSVAANASDAAALQELAVAYYNLKRYDDAAATYLKLLALKGDAFTQNNYANVLRDSKKLDEAVAAYRKAIALDKTLVTPYINLAALYEDEADLAQAARVLKDGIAATQGEDRTRLEEFLSKVEKAQTDEG